MPYDWACPWCLIYWRRLTLKTFHLPPFELGYDNDGIIEIANGTEPLGHSPHPDALALTTNAPSGGDCSISSTQVSKGS